MLGKRLKSLRTSKKLTQKQLAEKINVTHVSISGYESGNRFPDTDTLQKLADYFEVTTDYLLGRDISKLLNNADKNEVEFLKWMDDPTTDLFFKEYINSPDEMKEQLRKIWDIIKEQQK